MGGSYKGSQMKKGGEEIRLKGRSEMVSWVEGCSRSGTKGYVSNSWCACLYFCIG